MRSWMMKLNFRRQWPMILGTLLVFAMSGWFMSRGIDFGLPELFHDDEHFIVEWGVKVASGDMHVTWFDWPASFLISTNGLAFAILNVLHNAVTGADLSPLEWFARDHSDFYLLARLQTVLFAFGIVGLTYALGKRWQGEHTGIIAALLVGVSYLLVRHAHFATPDVPLAFFLLLATYAGVRIGQGGDWRWYAIGGLAVGFGTMTKYTGIAGVVPVIFGHVLFTHRPVGRELLLFAGVVLCTATIASPFLWVELQTVFESITKVAGTEHVGRIGLTVTERLSFYMQDALSTGMGFFVLLAALATILITLFQRHRISLLLLTTATVYFLGIVSLGTVWERYMVPLAPFIALFAARRLTLQPVLLKKWSATLTLLIVTTALFLPSLTRSLIVTEMFARTEHDTRFQARAWIEEHLPNGTVIAQEKQTPRLSVARYKTMTSQYLSMHSFEEYSAQGVEYAVVSSEMYDRFFANDREDYADERAFYITLFETRERVYHVEGNESGFRGIIGRNDLEVIQWLFTESPSLRSLTTGPDISIYQL